MHSSWRPLGASGGAPPGFSCASAVAASHIKKSMAAISAAAAARGAILAFIARSFEGALITCATIHFGPSWLTCTFGRIGLEPGQLLGGVVEQNQCRATDAGGGRILQYFEK